MAANSIMNSAFQKIGVFGKTQRGSRMLRILLADDEPIFLSKMEHLLMQYAEQKQLNVQIGAYTRDDMSSFILQPYDIAFLDIDFGNRRGAGMYHGGDRSAGKRLRRCPVGSGHPGAGRIF